MRYVGSSQYRNLLSAMQYYTNAGYHPLDVPWCVSDEAMTITRPVWAGTVNASYLAGGKQQCPVASAEQSFIQLQLDQVARFGMLLTGTYVAITPCFRNEPELDDLHQPYFMKVELYDGAANLIPEIADPRLNAMIERAERFFHRYLDVVVIPNEEYDPLKVGQAFDIVTKEGRIELGSYGIRKHPKVGTWVYGTGCAEPRLSYAIEQDILR